MSIHAGICKFYRTCADQTITVEAIPNKVTTEISSIPRWGFPVCAVIATALLVKRIAISVFFLAASIVTFGLHEGMKTSLSNNVRGSLVYVGVISSGLMGLFFPQTINERVLRLPYSVSVFLSAKA